MTNVARLAVLAVAIVAILGCDQRVQSPNEEYVAIASYDGLRVMSEATGRAEIIAGGNVTHVGWSHRSDRLAFQTDDGRLGVISRTGGRLHWTTAEFPVAWSPDDSKIAALGPERKTIDVMDSRSLKVRRTIHAKGRIESLEWTRTGSGVCAQTDRSLITFVGSKAFEADCGGKILAFRDVDSRSVTVAVETSPQESEAPRAKLIQLDRFTGRKIVLREDLYPQTWNRGINDCLGVQSLGFSPSGRYLALAEISDSTEFGIHTKLTKDADHFPGEYDDLLRHLKLRIKISIFDVNRPHDAPRRVNVRPVSVMTMAESGGPIRWMNSRDLLWIAPDFTQGFAIDASQPPVR